MIGVNPAGGWMCAAFRRIPIDILSRRVDHRKPIEGDRGVQFEVGDPFAVVRADAEFREEDHPRGPDGKFGSDGSKSDPWQSPLVKRIMAGGKLSGGKQGEVGLVDIERKPGETPVQAAAVAISVVQFRIKRS